MTLSMLTIEGTWRDISGAPLARAVTMTAMVQTPADHVISDEALNRILGLSRICQTDPDGMARVQVVKAPGVVYRVVFGGVEGHLRCDDWDDDTTVPFVAIKDVPGGDAEVDPLTWDAVLSGLAGRIATLVPPAVGTELAAQLADPESAASGLLEDAAAAAGTASAQAAIDGKVDKGALTLDIRDRGASAAAGFDNSAIIQDALDAIAPFGGQVLIPAGRWEYASPILVPSGASLVGVGQRLWTTGSTSADRLRGSTLVPTANGAYIGVEGATGMAGHREAVQLRDFTIDGNGTTQCGIRITNVYDVTLSRVFVRACITGILIRTLSAADYVENLRLRDVKITNGAVGIDTAGTASKAFVDSAGLHIRNMTTAAVKGWYTGIFTGGFIGRVGSSGAGDGVGFDLTNADSVTVIGTPFENVPTPIRAGGQSYGLTVLGIITNSSEPGFGLVRGIDLQDCDGWVVSGCKFLFTNGTLTATGIFGSSQARYGTTSGCQFQNVTGSQVEVSLANPGVNHADVSGRFQRLTADALYVGDGTAATSAGIGGAAATTRSLEYYTGPAGVTTGKRWAVRASAAAEAGSDGGSDYEIVSYTDSGAGAAVRMRVRRSDGRISMLAPMQLMAYTTAARPTPAAAGVGGVIYDSTLGLPIYSNGSSWRDATGAAV